MEKTSNEIINSVCEKLGNALNELSEARRLHGKEVCELERLLQNALGLMKLNCVKIEGGSSDINKRWEMFIKQTEEKLRSGFYF